jgi:uncharacterized Tic20 family protein
VSKEINKDARMWAMFCHLVGLAVILPVIPLFGGAILLLYCLLFLFSAVPSEH